MAVVLVIPAPPPPGINTQEKMHWGARHRLRRLWQDYVAISWMQAGRPHFKRPIIKVRLYYRTNRRRDADNAAAAIKPLLDGLKGRAWPGDDDADTIVLEQVELLVDRRQPRVEIELREAEEAIGHAEGLAG